MIKLKAYTELKDQEDLKEEKDWMVLVVHAVQQAVKEKMVLKVQKVQLAIKEKMVLKGQEVLLATMEE